MLDLQTEHTPSDRTPGRWRMPAETAPQERVWMAFPRAGSPLSQTAEAAEDAHRAWAAVANAILAFEPVTMLVDPADLKAATRLLSAEVEVVTAPLNDAWMRDIGPTFVLDQHGALGAVDWVFNGWGAQHWARWDLDAQIGATVASLAGCEPISSTLVNEGGAVVVDGLGTVLVTETVQLDPYRNPTLDRAAVEAQLAATIGAEHVIWLPYGLARDAQDYGTRGHVDMVAAIPSPGQLLLHSQTDPAHPDHEITRRLREHLAATRDVSGGAWEITEIPGPTKLRDAEGWVDYNYINHLVVNGAVIACSFDDPGDAPACELLAAAYPGREVVAVDARSIFARGGGIHCITQQQPSATPIPATVPGAKE